MKNWNYNNESEQWLKSLLNICSPSSMEIQTADFIRREWTKLGLAVKTDVMGNVYGRLNPDRDFTIALVAHTDVVAVQISKALDNGLLLFRNIGAPPCSLAGQRVTVFSGDKETVGVIGYDALMPNYTEKALTEDDLWIDIGASSKTEALKQVSIGDFAVFHANFSMLGTDRICSAGLDDRIGVFILNEAMKQLAGQQLNLSVCAVGSVQEEIGLRGAAVIGSNQKIDACIIVDVDFATDIPNGKGRMTGELALGNGVGVCKKANNNPVLQSLIIDVAKKTDIPFQINLGRNIKGGTDAEVLQTQLSGIATANISIPCRYMHSASEVCDIKDVESAVNLIINVIREIDGSGKRSFIPGIN
jgi:endoglucanase